QTIAAQQRLRMVADGDVLRVSSQLIPNHENPFRIEIKEFAVRMSRQNRPRDCFMKSLNGTYLHQGVSRAAQAVSLEAVFRILTTSRLACKQEVSHLSKYWTD